MLDILDSYLCTAVSPELYDLVSEAHQLFERMELQDYELGFEQILMMHDSTEASDTPNHIVTLTEQMVHKSLSERMITLEYGTILSDAVLVLHTLLDSEVFEGSQDILNILAMDLAGTERLAEVLSLVSGKEVEVFLILIEDVKRDYLLSLAATMQAKQFADGDDESEVFKRKHIEKFKKFCDFIGTTEMRITAILVNGVPVGFPFGIYANLVGRDFESMPPLDAARNLLGMAYVSRDGIDTPQAVIKDHIEHFVADVGAITRIDILIGDLILGFNEYKKE